MIAGIVVRNVHQALPEGAHQLLACGERRESRNGPVLVIPGVYVTEYQKPTERVAFWAQRDANPFFHFFESLWMLAGREDVAFLAKFTSKMAQYSDDGVTFHAAYGYRWKEWFGRDQLWSIIKALTENKDCRRQVLGMWDPEVDLGYVTKDLPCNTHAYFQRGSEGELNMTVCNRSNDVVLGAYGANAVHFSFLQEWMASMIKCPVGSYWQFSANTHCYLQPHGELLKQMASKALMPPDEPSCPYSRGDVAPYPLVSINAGRWERDFSAFLGWVDGVLAERTYADPFFEDVAKPLYKAHCFYSAKEKPERFALARGELLRCAASDWRRAAWEWLERREAAWRSKQAS